MRSRLIKLCPIFTDKAYVPLAGLGGWDDALEDFYMKVEALHVLYYKKYRVKARIAEMKEKYGTLRLDAHAFVDFYESKGWKVGNAAMKDWRACVRTWESREKHSSPRPSSRNTTNKSSNFQVMRDMLERNRATMQGGQVDEQ